MYVHKLLLFINFTKSNNFWEIFVCVVVGVLCICAYVLYYINSIYKILVGILLVSCLYIHPLDSLSAVKAHNLCKYLDEFCLYVQNVGRTPCVTQYLPILHLLLFQISYIINQFISPTFDIQLKRKIINHTDSNTCVVPLSMTKIPTVSMWPIRRMLMHRSECSRTPSIWLNSRSHTNMSENLSLLNMLLCDHLWISCITLICTKHYCQIPTDSFRHKLKSNEHIHLHMYLIYIQCYVVKFQ